MTNSAPSSSEAFELFHPAVQRWIYDAGWVRLHPAQEQAAARILAGDRDVIIAAATASGKSEAAWLPICSALARNRESGSTHTRAAGAPGLIRPGIQAIIVSPLKALINDQYERLAQLCDRLDIPVHRWHGDVATSRKKLVLRAPEGVLLITPESIESLFVNHGDRLARVFGDLRYIIVDELHAFIGTARGAQLQSLLHRIELVIDRRVPRIALSATLGDFSAAARFLRPSPRPEVDVVSSDDDGGEIRLQLRGYVAGRQRSDRSASEADTTAGQITDHLFKTLHENDNLVFANSRAAVETYADLLSRRSQETGSRAEFLAHHGSLAKDIREHVEDRLKDVGTPVTAICTSTLELGIDVGSVHSIAQIGAPLTVSSLRQRLGRSGRRPGQPAILRLYISEAAARERTPPPDALRGEIFQTVAMVELLLAAWYEPPHTAGLHLSTLIQQILSALAQHGGLPADQLYQILCAKGPFVNIDRSIFAALLRDLGVHDLIRQDQQHVLLPGGRGDRILNHYSFYAAFQTSQDYRLVANARTIGTLPVGRPILPGTLLIFGGRRWRVLSINLDQRVIQLTESGDGEPPAFPGNGSEAADEVRRTMRALYLSQEVPRYLDATAKQLLAEGREIFHRFGHAEQQIFGWGTETLLFPWSGDRIMNTLLVTLCRHGLSVGQDGLCLTVKGTTPVDLWELLQELAAGAPPDPLALASTVRVKARDKYDRFLGGELLNLAYAARSLDVPGTWSLLSRLAALPPPAIPKPGECRR